MPVETGYVGQHKVNVLRDSGCSSAFIKQSLVDPKEMTGKCKHCVLIDGTVKKVEVAKIYVETPFYNGELEVLCMENPIYDLIIGNVAGVKDPFRQTDKEMRLKVGRNDDRIDMESNKNVIVDKVDIDDVVDITQSVQTRTQKEREKKGLKPLKVSDQISAISPAEIIKAQQEDETLNIPRQRAESGEKMTYKNGSVFWYVYQGNMLYREFQSDKVEHGRVFKQLVVPKMYRNRILQLGHDSIFSGHLGVKKMTEKVLNEFHWPGVQGDIIRYCRSCDVCQRIFPKGKVSKIPIGEMPFNRDSFYKSSN